MYKPRIKKMTAKCPKCDNPPQRITPKTKTKTCVFCGYHFTIYPKRDINRVINIEYE